MNPQRILNLLEQVKEGKFSPKQALEGLKKLPFENLGFANVDHHRHLRKGFAEVIYAPGKTLEQITKIAQSIKAAGHCPHGLPGHQHGFFLHAEWRGGLLGQASLSREPEGSSGESDETTTGCSGLMHRHVIALLGLGAEKLSSVLHMELESCTE